MSRVDPKEGATVKGLDITVHQMNLSASLTRLDQFREETARDAELTALRDMIMA